MSDIDELEIDNQYTDLDYIPDSEEEHSSDFTDDEGFAFFITCITHMYKKFCIL